MNKKESAVSKRLVSQCGECANLTICENTTFMASVDMPDYLVVKCRNFKEIEKPQQDCSKCKYKGQCDDTVSVKTIGGDCKDAFMEMLHLIDANSQSGDMVILSAHPKTWNIFRNENPEFFKTQEHTGKRYIVSEDAVQAGVKDDPSLPIGMVHCQVICAEPEVEAFDIYGDNVVELGVIIMANSIMTKDMSVNLLYAWRILVSDAKYCVNGSTNKFLSREIPEMWNNLDVVISSEVEERRYTNNKD